MSAEDWGYQWSHQQALLHGPLNPTLSEFVPQPQLLTPNSNPTVDNDTPAGAELDSAKPFRPGGLADALMSFGQKYMSSAAK